MIGGNFRAILKQVVVGMVVALCAVSSGLTLGFSAISVPQFKSSNTTDHLDEDQVSWFASISSIATPFGCLICGPLLDAFGRKLTLLVLNGPFLAGWILLASAPQTSSPVAYLYAGRILTGFATGMAAVPSTVYLGEMSQPSLRGMFVTWTSLAISLGILLVYVLGSFLQSEWRIVAAICAGLPLVTATLVLLLVPESPVWLMGAGRPDDAENALKKLRGIRKEDTPESIKLELERMTRPPTKRSTPQGHPLDTKMPFKNEISHNPMHSMDETNDINHKIQPVGVIRKAAESIRNTAKSFKLPQAWKPLIIMNGFFFFQQFTGIYVVVSYAVDIVSEAGVSIDPYLATVLLGAIQCATGVAVGFILNRCGRRPMSVVSGIGQTASMLAMGLYLQFAPRGATDEDLSWIPLLALLVFVVSGAIGFHTLPWSMLGEVFPARVRGVAAGLTTCFAYIYSFIMLKVYPSLVEAFRDISDSKKSSEGTFYFFGVVSFLAIIFVILFLPETHGKSLQQIESEFERKTRDSVIL